MMQACALRILQDIAHLIQKFLFVAHETIVGFILPECPFDIDQLLHLMGSKRFPRMQDVRELVFTEGPENHVHVVRHNAPGEQLVAVTIEVFQSTFDQLGYRLLL